MTNVTCPECKKSYSIDLKKATLSSVRAKCRQCDFRIPLSIISCTRCSNRILAGATCDQCGSPSRKGKILSSEIREEQKPKKLQPEFTGTASEYFNIWIVNTFLTILTFGIYSAWAKVRTRQYFYTHTRLEDQQFSYLADPLAILRGNLLLGLGLFLYMSSEYFGPLASGIVVILFYLFIPFLIFKSIRFYAHNSAHRNIRFRFIGSLKESYITYLLFPMLIPFTLGLIVPYWAYRRKKYFFENFSFGSNNNTFSCTPKEFYKTYGIAFGIVFAMIATVGALSALLWPTFGVSSIPSIGDNAVLFVFGFIFLYVLGILVFTFLQQYIYARITNYCWSGSELGSIRFDSALKASSLLWISFTNIVAILFSFGLLMPWAKIRRYKYIIGTLTVSPHAALDIVTASFEPDNNALGDAASDYFDFEIGL